MQTPERPTPPPSQSFLRDRRLYISLLFAALMATLFFVFPMMDSVQTHGYALLISEVCASNDASITDPDYGTPDWIELWNTSDRTISLAGYSLARAKKNGIALPDQPLKPGERAVVYCAAEIPGAAYPFVSGFTLPAAGGALALLAPGGVTAHTIVAPRMETDVSYGVAANGAYGFFAVPSPGAPNPAECAPTLEALLESPGALEISQVVPLPADGSAAWVELRNASDRTLQLARYYITDNPSNPSKARLPDVSLAPGGRRVFTLSPGADGDLPFGLKKTDSQLLLSNLSGAWMDSLRWDTRIYPGYAAARDASGATRYFRNGTPGAEPDGEPFPRMDFAIAEGVSALVVREVVRDNTALLSDRDGGHPAYALLENASDLPVNLAAYALSDDETLPVRFLLPERVIAPGAAVAVFLTGEASDADELHAPFRLGRDEIALYLLQMDEGVRQTAQVPYDLGENERNVLTDDGVWQRR